MPKITFMGAGSTVFAKNVLGYSMVTPALAESTIALYDIDPQRLEESYLMITSINNKLGNRASIEKYSKRRFCHRLHCPHGRSSGLNTASGSQHANRYHVCTYARVTCEGLPSASTTSLRSFTRYSSYSGTTATSPRTNT